MPNPPVNIRNALQAFTAIGGVDIDNGAGQGNIQVGIVGAVFLSPSTTINTLTDLNTVRGFASFTVVGAGNADNLVPKAVKYYAYTVTSLGATTWDVRLEISINGAANWTQIGTPHTNVTGSGIILFVTAPTPADLIRFRCAGITVVGPAQVNCNYTAAP
jgi:hypothetical protein